MLSMFAKEKIFLLGPKQFNKWKIKFSPEFSFFEPKHYLNIETKHYRLTVAEKPSQLYELFKLRYEIFLNDDEPADGGQIDFDEYDSYCDHMMIIDKKHEEIVGTYRLMSSDVGRRFYSESEFEMEKITNLSGGKLELGRACIHPHHRNGQVLDLLWRGIAEYAKKTQTRYLFGCSSVKTDSLFVASGLASYFSRKLATKDENSVYRHVTPTEEFESHIDCSLKGIDHLIKMHVPSLLKSYMMAGAHVCPYPAYDKDFKCFDFLTVLDLNNLSHSYKKRYFKYLLGHEQLGA